MSAFEKSLEIERTLLIKREKEEEKMKKVFFHFKLVIFLLSA